MGTSTHIYDVSGKAAAFVTSSCTLVDGGAEERKSSAEEEAADADGEQNVAIFNHGGTRLATGGTDGVVRVWKLTAGRSVSLAWLRSCQEHSKAVVALSYNRSGSTLASASADGTVKLWRVLDGACVQTLPHGVSSGKRMAPMACLFHGNDTLYVVTTGPKQATYLARWTLDAVSSEWKPSAAKCISKRSAAAVCLSQDGRLLGAGFSDGAVAIYSARHGDCMRTVEKAHELPVSSVTFVAVEGGVVLVAGSVDWTVSATRPHSSQLFAAKPTAAARTFTLVALVLLVLLFCMFVL
eukprot:PLAT9189.4.p1 GENE.PLAT9189.4~~PLAT9189.4.p1  ORF type:complete len:296 (-),score=115.96 PLAT9189.4:85-972(-)